MNKGVDQIITRIAQDIDQLKKGNLTVSELTELTELSRDLYEILLVTRYQKMHGAHTSPVIESTKESEIIKEGNVEEQQTIEEPIKENDLLFDFSGEPQEENTMEEAEAPLFDLEPQQTETMNTPTHPVVEKTIEEPKEQAVIPNESEAKSDFSLNTNYQDNFSNSIANKMQLSPITSLSGHISLNQRFSFIANLFDNNAENYNQTIASIDKMAYGNEAKETLNTLQQQYNWDLENKEVIEFVTLVERRFI